MAKNYYDILGVSKSADKEEIKRAFHKLAHKYHPDKKGGDETKFKEINEAYQVLSNAEKRQQYDAFGSTDNFARGGGAGAGGFDFSGFAQNGGGEFDFGDIFSEFFSAGGRGATRQRRGRDISVDIQIPFAEAVFGTEREILINKIGTCATCSGSGAKPGSKAKVCPTCNGKGQVHETRRSFFGAFSTTGECATCHGRGQVPEEVCPECGGLGARKQSQSIKILVPPGIENGEMIRLAGQGEAAPGGVAGDLYVRVHVEADKVFRREGANLLMDLPVKLTDSLLGTEMEIATLDGATKGQAAKLKVKIPAGINYGELLRVHERGVPIRPNKRGDLLIRIVIKTPTRLSKKATNLIKELKDEGI